MKREIKAELEIPEGIEVEIIMNDGKKIVVKGKDTELNREFRGNFNIEKKDNKIIIFNKKGTKRELKLINTIKAHISNMFSGAMNKFEYKLEIASVHFPMTVKEENRNIVINNFLGETKPRIVKIPENAEVKIDNNIITVSSNYKEIAGQLAANIEKATKIKARDRRIFQDGIFMIEKAGREI